ALDLLQRKRVVSALVPVALAIDGVKREAHLGGLLAPIRTFIACDALHGVQLPDAIPWPVEPKPPRVAPGADVNVEDVDAPLFPDPFDRPQMCQPLRLPDVVLQG